ncbi:hypothetical protein N018_13140 [Pseudomonas syringae CC1557]|uniref:Uncharacterized protein n=1 Tax=Pseudomonas syringae CC1557 TaxID=1357279 RepID=W0MRC4_PSESX|nr:hypothetical protein [Pseudomonas syringae]AHG41104.1 hypothetical protein N018_13140 [Pseudomonas syringae CC1557]
MKRPIMEPRLVGARFSDHTIPLELLKDLSVLEEFLIAVAKWKYVQDNDRIRTPKGFTAPLSLALSAVNPGSAKAAIAIEYNDPSAGLFPAANEDYFFRAAEAIGNAIDAAERNEDITRHLPTNLLGYFDRFGRGLREGEILEFFPGRERPARLSKLTRRRLLLASENEILTDEITVRGLVSELDLDKMSFELQTANGRKIAAGLDAIHLDVILEAMNGYLSGVRVSVSGIGRFDRNERLDSFDMIEDAAIIESIDPLARLDELRLLRPGWLDGIGRVPARADFDWLEIFFEESYPSALPVPYLYPTEEGGIQLEWRTGNQDLSLEILFPDRSAELHGLNTVTFEEIFLRLSLNDKDDVAALIETISQAAKGEI